MDLHISLIGRRGIAAQVYRQVRAAILDGRLRAGEALPATRGLARAIGVSRTTVLEVYERLSAEGFVETRPGAGTYVSKAIESRPAAGPPLSPLRPRGIWAEIPEARALSTATPTFDFRPGIPDARAFPYAALRARVAGQFHPHAVGSGANIAAAGHPDLCAAVARHIGLARGVRAVADDILITSGSQQAMDLATRVLLEPGDRVAIEDPGYPLPRGVFLSHGCRVSSIPVDDHGLVVDALPADTRLVYVTPSHQYPLGMPMSMERRQALLAWAVAHDSTILEDDYDSEFRYGGRPLEPLHTLDHSGRVIYVGSFSKVLLPTLRLGFLVTPGSLRTSLRKAKQVADWHTAVPVQAALARFMEDGLLVQHLRRMRRTYDQRSAELRGVLERDFKRQVTVLPAVGGLHLAATFNPGVASTDLDIAERAATAGIAVLPLSPLYVHASARQGLLFGFGAIEAAAIQPALDRLRSLIDSPAPRA
jgi:GntR family transcriptional regulator/MocR family aminotransferase